MDDSLDFANLHAWRRRRTCTCYPIWPQSNPILLGRLYVGLGLNRCRLSVAALDSQYYYYYSKRSLVHKLDASTSFILLDQDSRSHCEPDRFAKESCSNTYISCSSILGSWWSRSRQQRFLQSLKFHRRSIRSWMESRVAGKRKRGVNADATSLPSAFTD